MDTRSCLEQLPCQQPAPCELSDEVRSPYEALSDRPLAETIDAVLDAALRAGGWEPVASGAPARRQPSDRAAAVAKRGTPSAG